MYLCAGFPGTFHQMPKKVDKKLLEAIKSINALNLDGNESSKPKSCECKEEVSDRFAKYRAERKRSQEAAQQKDASSSSESAQHTTQ